MGIFENLMNGLTWQHDSYRFKITDPTTPLINAYQGGPFCYSEEFSILMVTNKI